MLHEHSAGNKAILSVSRTLAILILLSTAGLIILGLFTFRMSDYTKVDGKGEDYKNYQSIIERIRSGESYYQAAHQELSNRGYPVESVFNWRLPWLGWLLGHMPNDRMGQTLAILLSSVAVLFWIHFAIKEWPLIQVAAGGLLASGLTIYASLQEIYTMHELWAGALIFISLFAYGNGWKKLSWLSGTLALFIRELALPFVVVMFLKALYERQRQEVMAWGAGMLAFLGMFFIHAVETRNYMTSDNILRVQHWADFNGWAFVLATLHTHPFLILLPSWITSVLVPLALLGLLAWRGPLGERLGLVVTVYMFLFLFVGKNFNAYWGFIYFGLLTLGLLRTHEAIISLIVAMGKDRGLA